MRKNQKCQQADMYAAIERCEKENMGYAQYCLEAGIHYATFKYWIKKYQREQGDSPEPSKASFLPVKLVAYKTGQENISGIITIESPQGIRIECPVNTPELQLTALLKSL